MRDTAAIIEQNGKERKRNMGDNRGEAFLIRILLS